MDKDKVSKFCITHKNLILSIWLGISIGMFGNIFVNDWRWWAIMVPAVTINGLKELLGNGD